MVKDYQVHVSNEIFSYASKASQPRSTFRSSKRKKKGTEMVQGPSLHKAVTTAKFRTLPLLVHAQLVKKLDYGAYPGDRGQAPFSQDL